MTATFHVGDAIECDCIEGCQVADRFTPATREILVFTKSKKRYFDLDAVREAYSQASLDRFAGNSGMKFDKAAAEGRGGGWSTFTEGKLTQTGAPPLDWWDLPWDQVSDRLVRAMVPERVCRQCGEPSRRIVDKGDLVPSEKGWRVPLDKWDPDLAKQTDHDHQGNKWQHLVRDGFVPGHVWENITTGFSDCGHDDWRPGLVLDPFQPGDEMTATFYVGDAIETMNKLPEKSVDLILTSPPFLALRSYLPADHPDKALEGGSQATPGEYIDWLVDVVEACARVLAPHGSMCIELGDTYAGSTLGFVSEDASEGYDTPGRQRQAQDPRAPKKGTGWPLAKSLSLIPELFRLTLVYGTNPLTGRQTDRWRLRNVVRWVRPNPPVGALGDKFRPATSELMVFCKSAKRYFDLDAVREPYAPLSVKNSGGPFGDQVRASEGGPKRRELGRVATNQLTHAAGAPPLDWWNIPPGGYEGAHYAVFPPELCVKPVKAMCPEKVCRLCGEPSRRITEPTPEYAATFGQWKWGGDTIGKSKTAESKAVPRMSSEYVTTGWSTCGHDDWRPGLVLDPFAGSGTSLAVATGHGRDAIGIDLDERNYQLALERVGPFILERAS